MKLAEELFDAYQTYGQAKAKAISALFEACGFSSDDEDWPLDDVTFDWYDSSFEFKAARVGWVPTMEQFKACFLLGFDRCWLYYTDGSEVYCSKVMSEPTYKEKDVLL